MALRDHIDFHNQEVIRIVDFARLWSQESGHSLAEIFEFLRVVLSKRTYWHGYVRKVDGSLYAHGYETDKAGRKISPIFEPRLLLHWLEQTRDQIQEKRSFVVYDYCLRRNDYIKLLTAERLPIPAFLLHPAVRRTQPPQSKNKRSHRPVVHTASATQNTDRRPTDTDPLAQIRQLSNLKPEEVSLTLLADNWIEVSAQKITKRVSYDALGLMDRRRKKVNTQGAALVALATAQNFPKSHAFVISRLRKILRTRLGIKSDPFSPVSKAGWEPRFRIIDKRTAQDDRARRNAKHMSLDDIPGGLADNQDETYQDKYEDDEFKDDDAARYIKEHDKRRSK